jgi:uncharacterized membrane protein YdjX (TVP38/TMEM64 family)
MTSSPDHAEPHRLIPGFLRRAAWRAALPYVIAGTLLLIAVAVIGGEIDRHLSAIEAWIAGLGQWGLLVFIVLFVLATSCLVPDSLLCLAAGALFGLQWGLIAAIVGMFLASLSQFTLARRLLRPHIQRMLARRPALDAMQRAVRHDEFRLQFLLRLTPLNPATASYVFGAVGVRLFGFLIACLALIPALTIEVYAGHAGRHMTRLAGGSAPASRLHELMMFGGLAVCVLVMVVISRLARNAVAQAVTKTETASDAPTPA